MCVCMGVFWCLIVMSNCVGVFAMCVCVNVLGTRPLTIAKKPWAHMRACV